MPSTQQGQTEWPRDHWSETLQCSSLWDITQRKYCNLLTKISSKLFWGEIQGSESDYLTSCWSRLFSFQFFQLCPSHFLPPPFVPSSLFFSSLNTFSLCFTVFYIIVGVQTKEKQNLFQCNIFFLRTALYVYVNEIEIWIKLSFVKFYRKILKVREGIIFQLT